jgi:tRNA A37 threonylcarbamoyladenosine synthetase subunit TsaC/SUA5/YrdC
MEGEVLGELVFLTQTDTTIGFISQNANRLTQIKQRPPYKYYIKALDSLHTLKYFTRVPNRHKNRIRRSRKTTFILPDSHSYRIIHDSQHLLLLNRLKWSYTTSANLSGHTYNETFAKKAADIIISPLQEKQNPSHIMKLGKRQLRRVR